MGLNTFRHIGAALALLLLLVSTAVAEAPADLRDDPGSYMIPEAWRSKAMTLVDPGRKGLKGGLTLERLDLGQQLDVRYSGGGASLQVSVVPSRVAPKNARWVG